MVLHRFSASALHVILLTGLIFRAVTLSASMPRNDKHNTKTNEQQTPSVQYDHRQHAAESLVATTIRVMQVNNEDGIYYQQPYDMPRLQASAASWASYMEPGDSNNNAQLPDHTGENTKPNRDHASHFQMDSLLASPSPETLSGLKWPQFFSSDVFAKQTKHVLPRAAVPPFPPIGGNIREGETTPSRGRSGSPRRIENFPPLQNQPGWEYVEAISRRTIVPLPPISSTTYSPTTTRPNHSNSTKPLTVSPDKETSTLNGTEENNSFLPVIESNRRMDDMAMVDTPAIHTLTTVENAPDIGTAFSLNEDFTDVHLTMKIAKNAPNDNASRTTTTDTSAMLTTAIHENAMITEPSISKPTTTERWLQNGLNFSTITTSTSATVPSVHFTTPLSTSAINVTTITNNPHPTNATENPITTQSSTTAQSITASSTTITSGTTSSTEVITTSKSSPSTTVTPKPTNRPSLRRRLPSFRSTSPRPTIRRRLPRPTTTTTTTTSVPKTMTSQEASWGADIADDMAVALEEEERAAATPPFVLPPEPTTTRRQYVMTVPPLLDYDNRHGDQLNKDESGIDSFTEATQMSSPSDNGGIIPEGATNAIIISGIIGGCAIVFFAILMIFCMWRQHMSRRPIYPPPDSSNSSSTSSNFHGKLG